MKLSLNLFIILYSTASLAQSFTNSIGGQYSSQAGAATVRDNTGTAIINNPAGLAKIKKGSFSSGATGYNLLKVEDDTNSYSSLASSSNHVAFIKSSEKYVFGFMLYNAFTNKLFQAQTNSGTNSEGLNTYTDQIINSDGQGHVYSFAIAKKDSDYGLAFNITNFEMKQIYSLSSYNHSNTTPSERKNSIFNNVIDLKIKLLYLSFGYQKKYNDQLSFGAQVSSPSYLIDNKSHHYADMLFILPNGTNDTYVYNTRASSKYHLPKSKYQEGYLNIGAAYQKNRYQFEVNFKATPADKDRIFNSELTDNTYTWNSSTDTLTVGRQEENNTTGDFTRATLATRVGMQYQLDSDNLVGLGISYTPTNRKDDEGVNNLAITAGYSNRLRSFHGHYAIEYNKAMDAGGNIVIDPNTQEEEKILKSYEQFSFIFGGSYTY